MRTSTSEDNSLTIAGIQVPENSQRHQRGFELRRTIVPAPCFLNKEFGIESYCYTYQHQCYADCTRNDKSRTASSGIDHGACYTWWSQKSRRRYIGRRVVLRSQGVHEVAQVKSFLFSLRLNHRMISNHINHIIEEDMMERSW